MPWTTATLVEKTRREGALMLRIVYGRDDNPETATEHLTVLSPPNVPVLAKAGLDRLNAILVADGQISTGPIVLPAPPDPPTKDAQDRATFVAAATAYKEVTHALVLGLATQADADAAKTAMSAAYKPGYDELLLMVGL